jgi:hypothetical protein
VKPCDTPAVVEAARPLIARFVAVLAVTWIPDWVPVIDELLLSVAVSDRDPAVFNVAENVPAPAVSVLFAGSTACASELENCTVPTYPVAVFPY